MSFECHDLRILLVNNSQKPVISLLTCRLCNHQEKVREGSQCSTYRRTAQENPIICVRSVQCGVRREDGLVEGQR